MEDDLQQNDFILTHKALFLRTDGFPSDYSAESGDVEMEPEDSSNLEEVKSAVPYRKPQKYEYEPLRDSKDVRYKNWEVNLRDKLNLNKYTKKIYSSKHKSKQRGASLKSQINSQQMYKVMKPVDPDKIMKDINLDKDFEVDYVELLTKYEFPAVLRLKKKFMTWFCKYVHEKIEIKKRELDDKKLQKEEEERIKRIKEEEEAEIKARKDVKVESAVPKVKNEHYSLREIDLIDPIENNPSRTLQCAFCLRKGQRKYSGRLIPFRANQFIHVNCALWTDNVFDDKDGHIINFYFSYKKARLTKCTLCNELGASISCERAKCENVYHFPCALRIDCHFSYYNKSMCYCPGCAKLYNLPPGCSDQKKTLDTKRRVYIVKHKDFQADMTKINDLKIDTWRPYFYDSFNRVGNCTILSLCENVDALIKVIKGDSFSLHNDSNSKNAFLNSKEFALKPYTSLRIYWKMIDDPTLEQKKLLSKDNIAKNKVQSYYLCKGDYVHILPSKDMSILRKSTSDTITQRLWGRRFFDDCSESIKSEEMVPERVTLKSDLFWNFLVGFIKTFKPIFTFDNIDFKYETFNAEEKFPVQFWNTAKADTKDKLLSSVESHWLLAQSYDNVDKTTISTDIFLENVIKINHGKEKISSLFLKNKPPTQSKKTGGHSLNMVQTFDEGDDYDTITDQRNLPISMRYRRHKENPKRTLVGPSKIHCQGLFAMEPFSQGDIVVEYVGEVIGNEEADRREIYYEKSGMSDCYLFRLDKDRIIDASYKGNMARFLNHSCDANCNAKVESISGEKHILILANRFISKGEELTYFYNFAVESEKIECLCGAPNCLRRLN